MTPRKTLVLLSTLLVSAASSAETSQATINISGWVAGDYGLRGNQNVALEILSGESSTYTSESAITFFSNKMSDFTISIRSEKGTLAVDQSNFVRYKIQLEKGSGGDWGSFEASPGNECVFESASQGNLLCSDAMTISHAYQGEAKPAIDGQIRFTITSNLDGKQVVKLNDNYTDTLTLSVAEEASGS